MYAVRLERGEIEATDAELDLLEETLERLVTRGTPAVELDIALGLVAGLERNGHVDRAAEVAREVIARASEIEPRSPTLMRLGSPWRG